MAKNLRTTPLTVTSSSPTLPLAPPPADHGDFFMLYLQTFDIRWTGFYRSIDKGMGNRYSARCIHCKKEFQVKPHNLHRHALSSCRSWSASQKPEYLKKFGVLKGKSTLNGSCKGQRIALSALTDALLEESDSDEEPQVPVARNRLLQATPKSEKKHPQDHQADLWYRVLPISEQKKIDKMPLSFILHANIPFDAVENPFFVTLIRTILLLYTTPSAEMLGGRIMNDAFAKELVHELDHEQDERYDLQSGWLHVLEIIDLSAYRHNAEFLHQELKRVIEINCLQVSSVIACVTESPASMVKLRHDLIVSRFQSIS
ncbi:hypothetical protein PsorP6_010809 [Peronosclerospora sorghi]|uniref:Uncharacterized protein n=1 Tax=Peronosclerospora sorghi TaxID=230839 RepID=A0ACC0VWM5_9STRA|nr:hypothetical protein PsorP6_010809 [Peronosclerospora sorghi]